MRTLAKISAFGSSMLVLVMAFVLWMKNLRVRNLGEDEEYATWA